MSLLNALQMETELRRPHNLFDLKPCEDIYDVESRKVMILGSAQVSPMGQLHEGFISPKHQAIVAQDGQLITISSKDYYVVQDSVVDAVIGELIAQTSTQKNPLILLGRTHPTQWSTRWDIVESEPAFDLPHLVDTKGVYFNISIVNSYDRSTSVRISAGFSMIHCGNYFRQDVSNKRTTDFVAKHMREGLEEELRMAILRATEIREESIRIASEFLTLEALNARDSVQDFHAIMKPLVEYDVQVHIDKLKSIIRRNIPLYGDKSFNVFMSGTEFATYWEHYGLPIQIASQIQNAVTKTFFKK